MSISKSVVVTGALLALMRVRARGATGPQCFKCGVALAADESAAIAEITYARVARERSCKAEGGATIDERVTFLRNVTIAEINPSWCKSDVHPCELRGSAWPGSKRLPVQRRAEERHDDRVVQRDASLRRSAGGDALAT